MALRSLWDKLEGFLLQSGEVRFVFEGYWHLNSIIEATETRSEQSLMLFECFLNSFLVFSSPVI